ncbi:hypothetical protein JEQ12_011834, partial [Ovis aries]
MLLVLQMRAVAELLQVDEALLQLCNTVCKYGVEKPVVDKISDSFKHEVSDGEVFIPSNQPNYHLDPCLWWSGCSGLLKKFTCHLCDRSFTEKWALNNHMKLHTGEKPFKCTWPTCHYSFLTASAMKDHYRTHTGEKSFLCDLCGFAGGTRHALTKHRRQHTGEKPFKCDECNFASTTQSHLTRHKRVHTGEKPYRCPWCDYRSNCAENIRKHILHTGKHEGVKMYNCPKCDYGTNIPVEFRNHLKEQHPDIENPDLAYLHAGRVEEVPNRSPDGADLNNASLHRLVDCLQLPVCNSGNKAVYESLCEPRAHREPFCSLPDSRLSPFRELSQTPRELFSQKRNKTHTCLLTVASSLKRPLRSEGLADFSPANRWDKC